MAHINLGKEWTKCNSTTVVVGGVIIVIRYQFLLHFLLQQGQLGDLLYGYVNTTVQFAQSNMKMNRTPTRCLG